MEVTKEQVKRIMPHASSVNIDKYLPYINRYAPQFGITTPLRMAHYLSQIAHESAELRYSAEIASGSAYEGRKDLGNTQKGDGKKYKGRGLIQITGRANYAEYAKFCGYDVVLNPELLSQPLGAVRSSMWFWQKRGLNALADMDDLHRITKKINGGYNGITMRKTFLDKAKAVLLPPKEL